MRMFLSRQFVTLPYEKSAGAFLISLHWPMGYACHCATASLLRQLPCILETHWTRSPFPVGYLFSGVLHSFTLQRSFTIKARRRTKSHQLRTISSFTLMPVPIFFSSRMLPLRSLIPYPANHRKQTEPPPLRLPGHWALLPTPSPVLPQHNNLM